MQRDSSKAVLAGLMWAIITVWLLPPNESWPWRTQLRGTGVGDSLCPLPSSDPAGGAGTPQRHLEQAGQLAVAVIGVFGARLVAQSLDAVAQGQQRAVDVGSLLHPLPVVLRLGREGKAGGKTWQKRGWGGGWGVPGPAAPQKGVPYLRRPLGARQVDHEEAATAQPPAPAPPAHGDL